MKRHLQSAPNRARAARPKTAVIRNSGEILCKAIAFGLLGMLLASGSARAGSQVYSKTLTFTQSTTAPAPPAPRRPYYAPANTKYSTVKMTRAVDARVQQACSRTAP